MGTRQTILRIENRGTMFRRRPVFVHGKRRFTALPATLLIQSRADDKAIISLFVRSQLITTAMALYLPVGNGLSVASYVGFGDLVPNRYRNGNSSQGAFDPLRASFFTQGDIFRIDVSPQLFQSLLVKYWRAELLSSRRFASRYLKASKAYERLADSAYQAFERRFGHNTPAIECGRAVTGVSKGMLSDAEDAWMQRQERIARREAFGELVKQVGKVPLPEIMQF